MRHSWQSFSACFSVPSLALIQLSFLLRTLPVPNYRDSHSWRRKSTEKHIIYKPVVQSKWAGSLSVLCSQWAVCKAFWLSTCGSMSVWWWTPGFSSAHVQAAPLPSSSCCTVGTLQNEPRTAFYRLAIFPSRDNPLEATWIFKGPSCFEFLKKERETEISNKNDC